MASPEVLEVTSANAKFANKFYDILSKSTPKENLFFSPLSAHTVLALAYQGASNETERCFAKTLNVSNKQITANGYNGIINVLNNIEGVTLHVANKIFVMKDFVLKTNFEKVAAELFLSEAQSLNFAANVEAAEVINKWIELKTKEKIKDLIKPDVLDGDTRLVLVNAIYFKGAWKQPFNKDLTRVEPFYTSLTDTVDCQMMHAKKRFLYCENPELDAKILQLPYHNKDVSMVLILPNAKDGISDLEKKLLDIDLSTLTNNCRTVEVDVALPKFKIETTMDLRNVLVEMGLGIIFDKYADFSEISDIELVVSKVVQKAFIEVNEEGAEAAAATAMVIRLKMCAVYSTESYEFIADHPFIFTLKMNKENLETFIFCGKFQKPT